MSLIPGTQTLQEVRTACLNRADRLGSTFIQTSELDSYIQASQKELYGLLIQKYGEDMYVSPTPFAIVLNNATMYPLPADFLKGMGVEIETGSPEQRISLRSFAFAERNRWTVPYFSPYLGYALPRYRFINSNPAQLYVTPPLQNIGRKVYVWYIPRLAPMAAVGNVLVRSVIAGDTLTWNGTVFTAVVSGAGALQFNVGVNDIATAQNLRDSINASPVNTYDGVGAIVGPAVNNVQLTLPQTPYTVAWASSSKSMTLDQPASFTNTVDGFNGWEEYIIIDVARKILIKEEADVSELDASKVAIEKRIESEASNRDVGQPQSAADTSGSWFDSPSSGGGGNFGGDW